MNILAGFADISLGQLVLVGGMALLACMPVHIYTAILDAAVMVGGVVMITEALGH